MLGLAIVMEPNDFSIISAKSMLINATRRINEYVAQCTDKIHVGKIYLESIELVP